MEAAISIDGPDPAVHARSLYAWLAGEDELRGAVRLVGSPPQPGRLGATTELLTVALAPGGVVTVLAGLLVAWVGRPTGVRSVTVTRADGTSVTVTTEQARETGGAGSRQLADQVRELLAEDPRAEDDTSAEHR